MVISRTNAVEASIQAVSPELIFEPSTSSGLVGAAGAAAGAEGAAAGAAGLSWARTGAHQPIAPSMASVANSFLIVVLPQSASAPVSPVRMRMTCCRSKTKILPSPIFPVLAFLPAESLDLGDGDALHADGGQGFAHLVKLERLDDCCNEFHEFPPELSA